MGAAPLSGLALAGCLLAVAMHWTLAVSIGSVTSDSLDRYFQSWQLAWIGHAAIEHPVAIADSNTFWPLENSLAFSDALYGYAPAGMVGSGPSGAMVRYNLLFLFSYALAFFGAGVLARELGFSWAASCLAGAAFAFAPWRIAQLNHLHVLSSGGIPLCVALLVRGYRKGSPGLVLGGWTAAAWQLSLGFTLGVQLAYLLGVLGAGWLAGRLLRRERVRLDRAVAASTAAGALLFAAVGVGAGLPLLEVTRDHPESRRSPDAVAFFSPPPSGFLAAPPDSVLWGDPTQPVRERLRWPPEMSLFPGLTVTLLAAAGLAVPILPRRWRWGLGFGIAATVVLCLGYSLAGGRFSYEPLYRYAPGWQASRTPGRLFTLTSLGLALLAAAGADGLRRVVGRGAGARSRGSWAALSMVGLLIVAVLAEGKARISLVDLPASPVDFSSIPEPQMHLPSDASDALFMLWSTDGFPRIFNGYAGFTPTFQDRFRDLMRSFPDVASVEQLRAAGIRSVVVHLDRVPGTPWAEVAERSIEGLGLERVAGEGFVVFRVRGGE